MRRLLPVIVIAVLLTAVFTAPATAAPHCAAGQEPKFVFGFAHLKSLLGDKMGEPVECEHANRENGDTLQQTTTGLAFYRNSTNTPTFTNGIEHWGWTSLGLVYWTGDSVDPPGVNPTTPVPTSVPLPTPIPVLESELPGHGGAVWSVSFSSDGLLLASGSLDRNAGIWDADAGARLHVLEGHTGNVMSVAFSEDGSVLATAGEDGGVLPRGTHTIALWDPDSGKKIGTLDGHFADVYSIAFSPDGNLLASGGWDRTLRLWDVSSRQLVRKLEGHSNLIGEVAFSPDGSMVAARHGGTVTLWNVAAGSKVGEISGLTSGWISDFAFHPGGNLIAVGLYEGLVLWDLSTSKAQAPLQGYSGRPGNIAFSPDGNLIAIGSKDYLVTLWDLSSRGHLHTIRAAEQGPNISFSPTIAFAPDGGTLAIGDRAGGISVWNVATGGRIRTFGPSEAIPAATPTTVPVTTPVPTESPTPTLVPQSTDSERINSALEVLRTRQSLVPGLSDVAATLSGMQNRISFGQLPANTLGRYALGTRSISLSNALRTESAQVVAMVLAHEGQHALDQDLGRIPGNSLACFDSEVRSFDIQISLWQSMWGSGGKTGPVTTAETLFNRMVELKQESPIGYVVTLIDLYGDQCGTF